MSKIILPSIGSGYASVEKLNNALQQIEDELNNKVLYRDNPEGQDNSIQDDLDMNGNRLLNIGELQADTILVNGEDYLATLDELATASADNRTTAEAMAEAAETSAAASAQQAMSSEAWSRVSASYARESNALFDTVADAVAAVTAFPSKYKRVQIAERANSFWDVVTGETADEYGIIAAGSNQLKLVAEGRISSLCYGIPAGASTPQNGAIKAFLSRGGFLRFEAGDYLIDYTGADTDGVLLSDFTLSIDVECADGANFIINGVDGDGIRIIVPAAGSGVPADGQTVIWTGGRFDQTGQKNSTTMPFIAEYPPTNPGTSATADALSIRGDYNNGTEHSAIKFCEISRVETYAGHHWENAGGDSGIFVSGCAHQIVKNCVGTGNRDLHIYASGSQLGTLDCKTELYGNHSINCFHGVAAKRSSSGSIRRNHAENCARAVLVERVEGTGSKGFSVVYNTSNSCGTAVLAERCTNFTIENNRSSNAGAILSDGTSIESLAGGHAFNLKGCNYGNVRKNSLIGVNSGYVAAYPSFAQLLNASTVDSILTTFVVFERNIGDGLARCGRDTGADNSFICNVVYNATSAANMSAIGTRGYEVRIDSATNNLIYRQPILSPDGSVSAPAIARSSQSSLGIRFATNAIHLVSSGADRFSISNIGVGFHGTTPVAKPTVSGSAGSNAALISLLSALASYGLITDSTT